MEIYYILGFIVFLILAKIVKKANKVLSKVFNTIGIVAVILTFTNIGNDIALYFNRPEITTICMVLSAIFFIALMIKFWIKTIKIFIITIILFAIIMTPLGIKTYKDFQNTEIIQDVITTISNE